MSVFCSIILSVFPTAALDRNLAYLGLVELLYGYPLDGVVLTAGCDKTTPALLMAAATVDIPAIVLSGGPMLDGHFKGELAGSGMVVWDSRKLLAAGEIGYEEFMDRVAASAPSARHRSSPSRRHFKLVRVGGEPGDHPAAA